MKYKRPRGTQDIVPPDIDRWRAVERAFEKTFDLFGYREIRTPIFEATDLFVRAVGEASDIVTKEMYTFEDRGGRSLTLRPENTASVIRAYLEAGMHRRGGIVRLCYAGPMFRYDRPQAGRYRQFHQVGAEAIGSVNPAIDVEMIHVVVSAMRSLGFDDLDLRLNTVGTEASRTTYRRVLLDAIEGLGDEIDKDALERYKKNPLRIFDSKDYGARLKDKLPVLSDYLTEDDAAHFGRVKELLVATELPFSEDRYLVRGLDYYTRTVFEIYHGERGAQNALCGGGRYDNLVAECGGPDTPAIGFSVGLERLVEALPDTSDAAKVQLRTEFVVACVGESAAARALNMARTLRSVGATESDLSGRSRKKQIQAAEKSGALACVIVDESNENAVTWRDLRTHEETQVADTDLSDFIAKKRTGRREGTN